MKNGMLMHNDMLIKRNQWTNWLPMFPKDKRAKFDSDYVGFQKKNDEGYHMGGCYIYAYDPTGSISENNNSKYGIKPYLKDEVIYIGTAGSSLFRGICSRTMDFSGTVIRGLAQKNPYENGMYFRALFEEKNKRHIYVSYYPMGFGEDIKIKAHKRESILISEYKDMYGSLPPIDGRQGPEVMIKEYAKALTVTQLKEHIDWSINHLEYRSIL